MRRRGSASLGIVLAASVLAGRPCPADEKRKSAFADPQLVQQRFEEACDAAEKVCGAPFTKRPTLRVCVSKDVRELDLESLREEFHPQTPQETAEMDARAVDSEWFCAMYQRGLHRVVVASDQLDEDVKGQRAEDILRIALAHEAGHAWAEEAAAVLKRPLGEPWTEAAQTRRALAEGHAHHVAARAAAMWGLVPAFDALTSSRWGFEAPTIRADDLPFRLPLWRSQDTQFEYVTAREFVARVEQERGAKGVLAVLRDPPSRARDIETPTDWLAGRRPPPSPRLGAALAALRTLLPSWAETQEGDVLRRVVQTEMADLSESDARAVLNAVVEVRAIQARSPFEFSAVALEFTTGETAETFVKAHGASVRLRAGAKVLDDRPGPDGPRSMVAVSFGNTLVARSGRYVLTVGARDRDLCKVAWMRDAMTAALAALADEHAPSGK
jgi:hypothetical protein